MSTYSSIRRSWSASQKGDHTLSTFSSLRRSWSASRKRPHSVNLFFYTEKLVGLTEETTQCQLILLYGEVGRPHRRDHTVSSERRRVIRGQSSLIVSSALRLARKWDILTDILPLIAWDVSRWFWTGMVE